MPGRPNLGRVFGPAAIAILGLVAIGIGAAIKTGVITVDRGGRGATPGDSTAVTVRTGAGEVEVPAPAGGDTVTAPAPSTPPSLRYADSLVAPMVPNDTGLIRPTPSELAELAAALIVPVAGVQAKDLLDTFSEPRGSRRHDALDIPAPRGTPVLSAVDGRVRRLYSSPAGGLMVYASDASDRFVLMYAHLDRYADGLTDTTALRRGETIGFVGTTGNAPPNVPHLHFAIARTGDSTRWWSGTPVDPRPLLQQLERGRR